MTALSSGSFGFQPLSIVATTWETRFSLTHNELAVDVRITIASSPVRLQKHAEALTICDEEDRAAVIQGKSASNWPTVRPAARAFHDHADGYSHAADTGLATHDPGVDRSLLSG
jgi:hypothetical protein